MAEEYCLDRQWEFKILTEGCILGLSINNSMETFGLSLIIMTLLVASMSIGLLRNKSIRGSCGGINCRCKNGST